MRQRETERDRDREGDSEWDKERQTETDKDRQTDRATQRDRQTDKEITLLCKVCCRAHCFKTLEDLLWSEESVEQTRHSDIHSRVNITHQNSIIIT